MDLQQNKGLGVEEERFKKPIYDGNMPNTCGKCSQNSTDYVEEMVHNIRYVLKEKKFT
jgi:hypothetical protein